MKIHFTWTITPNQRMQEQSKLLIASIGDLGPSTIWVRACELFMVDPTLACMAEIKAYQAPAEFTPPWGATPKWRVETDADVVVGCDADVLVWDRDRVRRAAEFCAQQRAVSGTIAYAEPFKHAEWVRLLTEWQLPVEFPFAYQNTGNPAPYYLNNGAIMMPGATLPWFRETFYDVLDAINARYQQNYFMSQVATSVAILRHGMRRHVYSCLFNYVECDKRGLPDLDQVTFLHYNVSREGLYDCEDPRVRARLRSLRDGFACNS